MKKIICLMFAAVLIAGCTQTSSSVDLSGLEDLGELPNVTVNGMNELGNLPPTNISIDLGSGMPPSNPFPSEPSLE